MRRFICWLLPHKWEFQCVVITCVIYKCTRCGKWDVRNCEKLTFPAIKASMPDIRSVFEAIEPFKQMAFPIDKLHIVRPEDLMPVQPMPRRPFSAGVYHIEEDS